MFAWEYPPKHTGGLGVHVKNLVENLRDWCEVFLYLPEEFSPESVEGVVLRRVNSVEKGLSKVFDINKKVVELILSDGLDVVHFHDWITFPSLIMLKKRGFKGGCVVTVHTTEFDRSGFQLRGWNLFTALERQGMVCADKVITISSVMLDQLVNKFKISNDKIVVIPNGIEEFDFEHVPFIEREGFIYAGRLTEQKGVEYLLYSFKGLSDELIVLGDGHLRDSLRMMVDLLGLNVKFLGHEKDRRRVLELIGRAKAIIIPSISEPFGIIGLEAALVKTPIIISSNAGVVEFLGEDCVELINPFKPETIRRAVKNVSFVKAEKAYDRVRSGVFNWRRISEEVFRVYVSTLSKSLKLGA